MEMQDVSVNQQGTSSKISYLLVEKRHKIGCFILLITKFIPNERTGLAVRRKE